MPEYLAIHAGHTRVKIGFFQSEATHAVPNCVHAFVVDNEFPFPWETIEKVLHRSDQIISVITGSNQVKVAEIELQWNDQFHRPFQVEKNSTIPVVNNVEFPEKVGADRLLNTVAVNAIRDQDAPAVTVDSGTAITVDAVSQQGEFLGGAILPGVLMGARAMHQFTTTLPLIQGEKLIEKPPTVIGTNTEDAMGSGLYWGHLGAVKELVARMKNELGPNTQLFITGGATPILEPYLSEAYCDPNLTLLGSVMTARQLLSQEA